MNRVTASRMALLLCAAMVVGSLPLQAADRKIFVANEGAGTVTVIDGATLQPTRSIAVGADAHNVQVSPDGRLAWVTHSGASRAGAGHGAAGHTGEVSAIDTETHQVVARVTVGLHPAHVVVSPDGRWVYVTNGGDDTVSVLNAATHQVVGTIPTGRYPHGIRFSPDGRQAYVANLKGGTVTVIDTETRQAVGAIPVGKGPAQVAFTPDGRLAFVSLSQEAAVAVIDPVGREVIRRVAVGSIPIQLDTTPDSRLLLVANQGSPKAPGTTLSLIDLTRFTGQTAPTGNGAHGVAVGDRGRRAYVTNLYANTVTVIDLQTRETLATVPVGAGPNGISVLP